MERNNEQGGEPLEPRLHRFKMEFDSGVEIECNPNNSMLFLHSEEPLGDHIFVFSTDEDDNPDGHPIFRRQLSNFDEVCSMMKRHGYQIIEAEYLTENDRKMYQMFLSANPNLIPQLPQNTLTDRQHNFANYFGYLLLHNHLTPEEFRNAQGDLYI